MLIEIRDKASSLVAYIIIGLLVLSFALWGIQEYFGSGTTAVAVADVNGSKILLPEFNNQLQWHKQRQRSALGDNYTLLYPNEGIIKTEVLDIMLNTELLSQEVNDAGFQISDSRLRKIIQQVPQFQEDGKFDPGLYERLLQVQRYSKARFETELRAEEKLKQFEAAMVMSAFTLKKDLQHFQRLSGQSRHLEYAVVGVAPDTVSVSAEEVGNYYQENQRLYRIPEQVRLAYIEIEEEALQDKTQVAVKDARTIFESQPERYMTAELRKTRHILLKVPDGVAAGAMEWDDAIDRASGLIKQLKEGASFSDLAMQYSEDSLSAEKGGDIGFIAVGDFADMDLEDALFRLSVGEYSEPVRTGQGVQILQLIEIKAAEQRPFEEVREQIVNERKAQLARQHFIEITDELANLVAEQPDNLQEAATSLDLKIQQTGWLAPNDNIEIFAYPKVRTLVFSDDILGTGLNSDLIEVAESHVIVFRVLEHKPSEQKTLDEVSEEIKGVLSIRKAAEQAAAKGQEVLAQMEAGASLQSLSATYSLEPVVSGVLRRDDDGVPDMIIERAFRLPRPAGAGRPEVGGVALFDGSFALIELQEVIDGTEQFDDEEAFQLSRQINYGYREFNAVVTAIKDSADIQVFESNL